MKTESARNAPDDEVAALIERLANDDDDSVTLIDALLSEFGEDARLHFLRGSMLAGAGNALEAHRSLTRAVALAPDFAVARFQLGFFELTSGEADAALTTWLPLEALPERHYLRMFVEGLRALIADRFTDCVTWLEAGMTANNENVPLNKDMSLIVTACRDLSATVTPNPVTDDSVSATALLLGRFGES